MKKQSVIYSVLLWGTATMSVGGCAGGEDLSSDDISQISSSTSAMKHSMYVPLLESSSSDNSEAVETPSVNSIVKQMEDEDVEQLKKAGEFLNKMAPPQRQEILQSVVSTLVANKKVRLSFAINSMKLHFKAQANDQLIKSAKENLKSKKFLYADKNFDNLELLKDSKDIKLKKQIKKAIKCGDVYCLDAMLVIVVYHVVDQQYFYEAVKTIEPFSKECIEEKYKAKDIIEWLSKLLQK